uniref:Reverse transcriptase domain, reverse transcriptase zinc-binding domain protein n=1 Tax=Tanacetum cinerariifolium TaxID=118510 RepID=A0A6L2KDA2_TANCI|nr:reverse transcriptase domain, reverse transcriptase zinc-binding domain protein [Tanacetum cinerariifolium]
MHYLMEESQAKRQKDATKHRKDKTHSTSSVKGNNAETTVTLKDTPHGKDNTKTKDAIHDKPKLYIYKCTAYVSNLKLKENSDDLYSLFNDVGGVVAIRITSKLRLYNAQRSIIDLRYIDSSNTFSSMCAYKVLLIPTCQNQQGGRLDSSSRLVIRVEVVVFHYDPKTTVTTHGLMYLMWTTDIVIHQPLIVTFICRRMYKHLGHFAPLRVEQTTAQLHGVWVSIGHSSQWLWYSVYARSDSHDHLFFQCKYAMKAWKGISSLSFRMGKQYRLEDQVNSIVRNNMENSFGQVVDKLILAASVYYIWKERNWRIFKDKKRTVEYLIKQIKNSVKEKFLTMKVKNSKNVIWDWKCKNPKQVSLLDSNSTTVL